MNEPDDQILSRIVQRFRCLRAGPPDWRCTCCGADKDTPHDPNRFCGEVEDLLKQSATYGDPTRLDTIRSKPSPVDRRRLKDGALALAASQTWPATDDELTALIDQLRDAAAAMQSLDDLGSPELNQKAQRDLDEIMRRHGAAQDRLRPPGRHG